MFARFIATCTAVTAFTLLILFTRGVDHTLATHGYSSVSLAAISTSIATQDSYVDSSSSTPSNGNDLRIAYVSSTALIQQQALVWFEKLNIPNGAEVTSATLKLYQTPTQGISCTIFTDMITSTWKETDVIWTNKPGSSYLGDSPSTVEDTAGWKEWRVTNIVQSWAKGEKNFGILLRPDLKKNCLSSFISKDNTRQSNPPTLIIEYVDKAATATAQALTATAAFTQTATAQAKTAQALTATAAFTQTATAQAPTATVQTPVIVPTILPITVIPLPVTNLIADKLEVTQAIQDLNNSVRLVKNKRTFVRFHVHSMSGVYSTYALLYAFRGASFTILYPINAPSGHINVRSTPDRGVLNHAFLFELPSGFREGNVTLIGVLNPVTSWRSRWPLETTYDDNTKSTSVSFESVPRPNLVLYRVGYTKSGTTYYPPMSHANQLVDWIKRAYPVHDVKVWNRSYDHGSGPPTCGQVNSTLVSKRMWDIIFGWFGGSYPPSGAHYYGLVDDGGGFMRGCALGIPAHVASGPTGTGTWGWDFDGSYGDWYGGHELGHTYGRYHAEFCGAGGGAAYPYTGGRISPALSGNTAIYGFDIGNKAIYGPSWKDVMTYCSNQWVSDFTYEGLMTYLQTHPVLATANTLQQHQDRLMVMGTVNTTTNEVALRPLFVVPNADDVQPRNEQGTYAIVLRDAQATQLARYPFEPTIMHEEGDDFTETIDRQSGTFLFISELVPFVKNTAQVDIEGPGGKVLKSVKTGATPPIINITRPNGGETLSGKNINVSWTASDGDGDTLFFNVQYSPDNGKTWEMLAQDIQDKSIELDSSIVVSSKQGLFRVWASDGMNTVNDVSDAPFTVSNHLPQVHITSPRDKYTIAFSQTLSLEGNAYDPDTGSMEDDQLEWTSSISGTLGNGEQLTVAGLVTGTHTITFKADDGAGGIATETITVNVLGTPSDIPTKTTTLSAGPTQTFFQPATNIISAEIYIDTLSGTEPISWTAQVSDPWIVLSKAIGSTPDTIIATFNDTGLVAGSHPGTITITNPSDASAPVVTIHLTALIAPKPQTITYEVFLPVIVR